MVQAEHKRFCKQKFRDGDEQRVACLQIADRYHSTSVILSAPLQALMRMLSSMWSQRKSRTAEETASAADHAVRALDSAFNGMRV